MGENIGCASNVNRPWIVGLWLLFAMNRVSNESWPASEVSTLRLKEALATSGICSVAIGKLGYAGNE